MASYKGHENVKVQFKSFYGESQVRQYIEQLNSDDIIDFQFLSSEDNGNINFMIVTKKEEDEYLDW